VKAKSVALKVSATLQTQEVLLCEACQRQTGFALAAVGSEPGSSPIRQSVNKGLTQTECRRPWLPRLVGRQCLVYHC
jgi:hypothetical protein